MRKRTFIDRDYSEGLFGKKRLLLQDPNLGLQRGVIRTHDWQLEQPRRELFDPGLQRVVPEQLAMTLLEAREVRVAQDPEQELAARGPDRLVQVALVGIEAERVAPERFRKLVVGVITLRARKRPILPGEDGDLDRQVPRGVLHHAHRGGEEALLSKRPRARFDVAEPVGQDLFKALEVAPAARTGFAVFRL